MKGAYSEGLPLCGWAIELENGFVKMVRWLFDRFGGIDSRERRQRGEIVAERAGANQAWKLSQ